MSDHKQFIIITNRIENVVKIKIRNKGQIDL